MERIGIRINVLWKLQKNTFSYNIQLSFRNEQAPCIFGRRRILILKDALCSWLFFFSFCCCRWKENWSNKAEVPLVVNLASGRRVAITGRILHWYMWLHRKYPLLFLFFLIHSLGLLEKLIRNKFSYSVDTKDLVVSSNYWSFTFK